MVEALVVGVKVEEVEEVEVEQVAEAVEARVEAVVAAPVVAAEGRNHRAEPLRGGRSGRWRSRVSGCRAPSRLPHCRCPCRSARGKATP